VPEEAEAPQEIPPHIMAAMKERMRMAQRMGRIKHKIIVMSGKGGVGKCVRRGTAILTGHGDWQAIETLATPVVGLDEEAQAIVRQKTGILRRRARVQLLHLRSGRTIGLTPDHLLYSYGGWRPLRALQRGDRVATIRWLPEPPGPDELTEAEARVLGLLLGDGSLTAGVPGFTNADAVILEVLDEAVQKIDPVLRVRRRGNSLYNYTVSGGRGGRMNKVMRLVRRLHLDVGSPEKYLPPEVFRSSNRILAAVLRGVFSTDGSVYDDKIEFSSTSARLASDVQRALLRFGIHSILRKRRSHYVKNGRRHPALDSYRLLVLAENLLVYAAHVGFWGAKAERLRAAVAKVADRSRNPNFDTVPLAVWKEVEAECRRVGFTWAELSRKFGYAQVPSTYGGHTYIKQAYVDRRVCPSRDTLRKIAWLLGSSRLNAIAESNIYWDQVEAIVPAGRDDTYDIEVEGSHNFIAEGVLVHNSTVAANVAVALASDSKVGLLDADVTGPDIPKLMGLEDAHIVSGDQGIEPSVGPNGVKVISMAQLLVGRDTPVIWRGPLKIKAIKQMMIDVNWGDLDFMVIDLPPGTSDEPLSIAQEIPDADGAVIVTTPQEVALLDVRKSIAFAQAVRLPILGVIENMSGLVCPHCGKTVDVFKRGGGEAAAKDLGLHFLGRIPLDPRIVVGGDEGKPFVVEHPDSPATKAFYEIVREIRKSLKPATARPTGPLAR